MEKLVPKLRFPECKGEWEEKRLESVFFEFKSGQGITSAEIFQTGLYPVFGGNGVRGFSNKYTHEGFYFLIGRQGALCGNINRIDGKTFVSEHAIACRTNEFSDTEWFAQRLDYLNLNRLSESSAQPGLAVNKLLRLKLHVPNLNEQTKIATFLTAIDEKLTAFKQKKTLLEQYKKGIMQQIFSQKLRFKDNNGNDFPDWEEKILGDFLFEHKSNSTGKEEVFSVSVHKGLINQVEHLGRVFAAKNTDNYNLVKPGDIVYTKSPTGNFPLGIIKQSKIMKDVIVSPLYGVFTPETSGLGYMLNVYFESPINVSNYLSSIIQKGAKNTINITNTTFLSKKIKLPISREEQQKIGSFLSAIDEKINHCQGQIKKADIWKQGLLQQLFV